MIVRNPASPHGACYHASKAQISAPRQNAPIGQRNKGPYLGLGVRC